MLWRLELRLLLRSRSCMFLVGLVLLLGTISLVAARWEARGRASALHQLRNSEEEKVQRLRARALALPPRLPSTGGSADWERRFGPRNASYANAWTQLSATRQFAPLASLHHGVSGWFPARYSTSWREPEPRADERTTEHPLSRFAGWLEPSLVLIYLYPLLGLATGLALFSSQNGPGWKFLFFSGAAPRVLLLRRLLIGAALLLVVAVAFAVMGTFLLGELVALVWVFSATYVQGLLWLLLGSGLALWSGESGRASLVGICVYAALNVLAPSAAQAFSARDLDPTWPTQLIREARRQEAAIGFDVTEEQGILALNRPDVPDWLSRLYQEHPWLPPREELSRWGLYGVVQLAKEAELERRIVPLRQQTLAMHLQYDARMQSLAYAIPALAYSRFLSAMAGTDLAAELQFREQARAFDRDWKRYFWPAMLTGDDFPPSAYDRIPRFRSSLQVPSERVRKASTPVALHALGIAVAIALLASNRWTGTA